MRVGWGMPVTPTSTETERCSDLQDAVTIPAQSKHQFARRVYSRRADLCAAKILTACVGKTRTRVSRHLLFCPI